MKYTGDTPSKKIARLVIWKRVKELLGPRFFTGTHVVLLSSKAGDVSTLLGLGVVPQHIVGADIDPHAVSASRSKYPDIRCLNQDVATVMQKLKIEGKEVVSVFLDFCAPLRDSTVDKAVEVTHYLAPGGVLTLAVKMGRENGEWAAAIAEAKAQVSTGSRTFYLRVDLLTRELLIRANGHKYRAEPRDFYRYSSVKTTEQRSEMLVCVSQLSAKKELKERPIASAQRIIREAYYSSIAVDHRAIGPMASLLAEHGEDAHLLLNLRPESIPAYKAHRTRGTYEGASTSIARRKWKN